ncbi:MAG: hypothetical protein ACTH3G_08585 [Citricoccus sp.]
MKPGDGRPLKRFRWWQQLSRGLMYLHPTGPAGREVEYAVDVGYLGDAKSGEVTARLYADGRLQSWSKTPAAFPVPGGTIEVATSSFGLKRCHFVDVQGAEHQLVPDPGSAEGRRARLERRHPTASRWIGVVSVVLLVVGVSQLLLQLAQQISVIPPIAESIGVFHSPVDLPLWLTIALTAGAVVGSTERALRLRYHWLLDAAGN